MNSGQGDGGWREVVTLAAPVVVSKLSFTAMSIADIAMVGRLGASAQGGVGIATTYMATLYVFALGVLGVINTFVSQNHGAGRPRECGLVLGQGLRLAAVGCAGTMLVIYLSGPLGATAGLSAEAWDQGFLYMLFRTLGTPAVFAYWAYNGFMEGLGDTQTPMRISLIANAVNIVLDVVLIFGLGPIPALGVLGAGLATAMANWLMLLLFLRAVHRRGGRFAGFGVRRIFGPIDRRLLAELLRTGLPMGLQFFLEVGAFLVFAVFVGRVGDAALAANQIALRIVSVSFMAAWGVSVAASTLVGRHLGEERPEQAALAARRCILLTLGYTAACALAFAVLREPLVRLFTPVEEVVRLAAPLMLLAAAFQVFDGAHMVAYGALRGAGDTRAPLWIVGLASWGLGIPLVWLLTIHLDGGVFGAWLGMSVMLAVQAVFMIRRFRSGAWQTMRVVPVAAPVAPPGIPAPADR